LTKGLVCDARRSAQIRLAALVLLASALFLPSVWNRDLWNPDEPRYAEAAREMTSAGDFILPHLNGDVYSEKPPLFFWLSIAAGAIPGVPPGSGGRLVSVLASAATMILTWRIGAIVMGEATGALAAALMSTTVLFFQLSQSGIIDPLLTALVTSALYGFTRHRCGDRIGMPIFYLSCALGVLGKGPVALIIPALAALTYTALADGPRALRARHPLWGIPLVALPVGLWLAAATARGGIGYAETMLVKQNIGRAYSAFIHKEPIHYFLAALPVSFLPWTLFLPQALVAAVREKIGNVRPMLFPLAWFSSTFVLFSIISSKKTRYMLPLFPAAALLVAGWMMRRFFDRDGRIRSGRAVMITAAVLGILLAGAFAAPVAVGERAIPRALVRPLHEPGSEEALAALQACLAWPGSLRLLVPSAILALACALSLGLSIRSRGTAFPPLLAGWALFLALGGALWAPVVNSVKSAEPLARAIEALPPGTPLHYVRNIHEAAINFYLRRDRIPLLRDQAAIREAGEDPAARFIGSRNEFARIHHKTAIGFSLGPCRRVGEDTLCLASLVQPSR